jgi:hypothetical protein
MKTQFLFIFLSLITLSSFSQNTKKTSVNPAPLYWNTDYKEIKSNTYADGKDYRIYPTSFAPYKTEIFFDVLSSKDLIPWENHDRILATTDVIFMEDLYP